MMNLFQLQEYKIKSDHQIEDLVQLIRGRLSTGARVTICALIVIDVHGISYN